MSEMQAELSKRRDTQKLLAGILIVSGCLMLTIFIGMGIVLLGLQIAWENTRNNLHALNVVEVNQYRIQWNALQIQDYILTVQTFGPGVSDQITLTVSDGEIIDVVHTYRNQEVTNPELASYSEYMVEGLFESAEGCFQFCQVEYNTEYSFPETIHTGFIEDSGMQVVDFQPLSSE